MIRIFTKIDGKVACWQCDKGETYEQGIKLVRDHLGVGHRGAILALVKY